MADDIDKPDLDFATFSELVAEIHKRLDGGAVVVVVENRDHGAAVKQVNYLGGHAAALGLVTWAQHHLLQPETVDDASESG